MLHIMQLSKTYLWPFAAGNCRHISWSAMFTRNASVLCMLQPTNIKQKSQYQNVAWYMSKYGTDFFNMLYLMIYKASHFFFRKLAKKYFQSFICEKKVDIYIWCIRSIFSQKISKKVLWNLHTYNIWEFFEFFPWS